MKIIIYLYICLYNIPGNKVLFAEEVLNENLLIRGLFNIKVFIFSYIHMAMNNLFQPIKQ